MPRKSRPWTYSRAMKYASSTLPRSKIWAMFAVLQLHRDLRLVDEHRDELFVLAMWGRMRLSATIRSKPSTP